MRNLMRHNSSAVRVRTGTRCGHPSTARGRVVLALLATLVLAPPLTAGELLRASVMSADANGVLVSSADSARLVPGQLLTLQRGRRELARVRVERALDAHLVLARLTSGSFARAGRLAKLRVFAEHEPFVRPTRIRLGVPGRGRASLLFGCGTWTLRAPGADSLYRLEWPGSDRARCVRAVGVADSVPWPDTLEVRGFSEALDAEIALERGELDLAMFWPGEPSPRLRADARWAGAPGALRPRGLLAALGSRAETASNVRALELAPFTGDLVRWAALEGRPDTAQGPPLRFSVEPGIPAHTMLERMLARATPADARAGARVVWLDVALAERGERAAEWQTRGLTPLYAVRCPLFGTAAARAWLAQVGADALGGVVECSP